MGDQISQLAREQLAECLRHGEPVVYLTGTADSGKSFVLADLCRELTLQVELTTSPLQDSPPGPYPRIIELRQDPPVPAAAHIEWPQPTVERCMALAQYWLEPHDISCDPGALIRLGEIGQRGLTPLRAICTRSAHLAILNRARLSPALVEEAAWAYDPRSAG